MTATRAPSVRRTPGYRSVLVAFLALGGTVGTWGARIPDVKEALDLDEGQLGTALLGLSIGAVAGAWLGGLLVRRVGSRRTVLAGWLGVGALLLLPGHAASWAALAAALGVLGLAVGVLDVSMNGAGVQIEHDAGVSVLSGLHAGWSGGVLAGAALGSAAVALDVSPAVHLSALAVVVVTTALVWGRHVPDGRIEPLSDEAAAGVDVRPARLAALAAIGGCVFLAEGALLDWSGVLVREDLDGAAVLGALAVTGVSAGGLAGRLAGDALAARWGPATLVRRGALVATGAFVLALVVREPVVVPLLLVVVGAGLAPAVPLAFAAAGRLRGEHGIAVVTTVGYGAYLTGPALIGGIAHAATLHVALVVPLALVAAVVALAWSVAPDR